MGSEISKISYGNNCKDASEKLSIISIEDLVERIKGNSEELMKETKFLRTIYKYSKERYRTMKTKLPFISMSSFDPPHRKYDHFLSAAGWIIDLDSDKPLPVELIEPIRKDHRVALSFVSPNGYGLKLIFLFDKPYSEKTNYSGAYKMFANELALKYNIIEYVDLKNCDVSRISFICHDAEVYYNSEYLPIDPTDYVPEYTQDIPYAMDDEIESEKKEKTTIPDETYQKILQKLGTKAKVAKDRPYVPKELLAQKERITVLLQEAGLEILEIEEIQYGLKVEARLNEDRGEILIYYGKKGYRLLTSPQKGFNHALSDTMRQLLEYQM